jgi:pimeloyl-ACP methyl ester carboxylesterase
MWSANDHYLAGERMKMSGRVVNGPWRYEQIDGATHWIPLDAPNRLNQLLVAGLRRFVDSLLLRYSMIDFPPVLRNSQ